MRIEVDLAADEAARDIRRALHASSTPSSRSRGASGIVTSTASGASRPTAQPISSSAADDGTPWIRRPPEPRVVVDEADDALAGRLAQLAQQAAPAAAGADDEHAALVSAADERANAARRARSQKRETPIEQRAEQHVDEEDAAREAVPRRRSPR